MRPPGENLAKGETLISKGQMITVALIGQLAASGTAQLPVSRRIRVAILSTEMKLLKRVVRQLADRFLMQIGPC